MITDGNWQDALEPIARKGAQLGMREIPVDKEVIYSSKGSKKLTETFLELGDVGEVPEFDGDLQYDDVSQGYKMTLDAREFAKGMKIQRKFVETDQLDIVESLPKMHGLAARRRIAGDVFSIFNEAFGTALTTIDALQLCSSAHTSNQDGIATTQANRGTAALAPVALESARQAMKAFMTNRDNLFEVMPDMIIIPRQLEEAGFEIIKSSGKVDTANNNRNFHMGRYKMLVSDWLDDSNNWFLVDSELMKQMTVWHDIVKPEFGQSNDFDGLVAKYRMYMFYRVGTRDWRWVYGSEVTG